MMHEGGILDMLIHVEVLQYIEAFDGMCLDYLIFVICQLAGFAEYLLGYPELAHIMQKSCNGKSVHIAIRHIEPHAEDMTDESHVHAVGKGRIVVTAHIVEHVKYLQSGRSPGQEIICLVQESLGIYRSVIGISEERIDMSLEVVDRAFKARLEFLEFLG